MKKQKIVFVFFIQALAQAALIVPSHAFDLAGAWATEKATCPRVFTKNATSIAFAPESEQWGKGFIVEGNTIRGLSVKCVIKSKKETKSEINMIASCATDIMIDQVQLRFKITGPNTITRVFPGIKGVETQFSRCQF